MPSRRNVWGIDHFSGHDYLKVMDQNSINKSFILPLDGLFFDYEICNNELFQWCAAAPERLIPWFTFEPRSATALKEIDRCVLEYGMAGVKLHPWLQGFRPTEDCMLPLASRLQELNIPIVFHDGTPPYSTPLQIAELAKLFPDLKVILGHGGLYDMVDEAIVATNEYPNVYISMTSLPTGYMKRIIENVDSSQLLFGSDGGLTNLDKESYVGTRWKMFRSLDLTGEQFAQICETNPTNLINGTRP